MHLHHCLLKRNLQHLHNTIPLYKDGGQKVSVLVCIALSGILINIAPLCKKGIYGS